MQDMLQLHKGSYKYTHTASELYTDLQIQEILLLNSDYLLDLIFDMLWQLPSYFEII